MRVQLERPQQRRFGFFETSLLPKRDAQFVVRLSVIAIQLNSGLKFTDGADHIPVLPQRNPAADGVVPLSKQRGNRNQNKRSRD